MTCNDTCIANCCLVAVYVVYTFLCFELYTFLCLLLGLLGGQVVKALDCVCCWGCLVAKWLKRWTADPGVPGSSPTIATGVFHLGVYSALPKK